jgi:hypothetical protein
MDSKFEAAESAEMKRACLNASKLRTQIAKSRACDTNGDH